MNIRLNHSALLPLAALAAMLSGCGEGNGQAPPPEPTTFQVSTTVNGGSAAVTPEEAEVEEGQSISFEIAPDTGFRILSASGCGGSLDGSTFTTGAVTADCTVAVMLEPLTAAPTEPKTFEVGTTVNGGSATVTPEEAEVTEGETASFTIVPDTGYRILGVDGCGGSLDRGTYVTGSVSDDCAVSINLATLAAPSLSVTVGNQEIIVSWAEVEGAVAYDLYYARESLTDLGNYAVFEGGSLVLDVASPHRLGSLTNEQTYFLRAVARAQPGRSHPSVEVTATPTEPTLARLNDTGQTRCADNTSGGLTCPVDGFPGQDGDLGRDALAGAGLLEKVGSGPLGFDYTKLGATGQELDRTAGSWSCIRDNVTGLVWEHKEPGMLDRGADRIYRWYDPEYGGRETDPFNPDRESTWQYLSFVNGSRLCGYSDWRLPTVTELRSIVNRGRTQPAINTDYFRISTTFQQLWATSMAASGDTAWLVDFRFGTSSSSSKNNYRAVKVVRGGD